jgi:hypothetical protein
MAVEHLQAFLDSLYEPPEQEKQAFAIDNDGSADWALRKIKQCQNRIDEIQATAKEQISLIERWMLDEAKKEEDSIVYFTGLLDNYHRKLYEEDPRRFKSIKLPNGVIKRVKTQPTFERDEEELLRWLEKQGNMENFINRTAKAKWGELKKQVAVSGNVCVMPITGEVVEGVTVTHNEEAFKVEVV